MTASQPRQKRMLATAAPCGLDWTGVLARGILEGCHSDVGSHLEATAEGPVGVDVRALW
jgi:hypothetical protein